MQLQAGYHEVAEPDTYGSSVLRNQQMGNSQK